MALGRSIAGQEYGDEKMYRWTGRAKMNRHQTLAPRASSADICWEGSMFSHLFPSLKLSDRLSPNKSCLELVF